MIASNPIPTNKSTPCPVCGDVSGKCRTFDDKDLILCMTADSAPGWKNLGFTKDGLWTQFAPDTESSFDRDEYQRRKTKQKRAAAPKTMSLIERDRYYSDWLSKGSLNERDRADLQRRGITDTSIALSCEIGYAIPFKGLEGKYVGAQWCCPDPGDGYRWHNLPGGKQFPGTDEMPIAVYRVAEPTMIALVEGTGVKPMLAAERLNGVAIGAAGGNHLASPIQLKAVIAAYPGLPLVVIPDAGDVINPRVMGRHEQTVGALRQMTIEPEILWWNQRTKDENDIDEATEDEIKAAIRLPWEEFKSLFEGDDQPEVDQPEPDQPEPDQPEETPTGEFTQVVEKTLYSEDPWISIDSKLHRWNGKYYEHSPDEIEIQRIKPLAEKISYFSKEQRRECFPNASPSKLKAALEWVKMGCAVQPERVNPPGLNCKNGVLQIQWTGKEPSFSLVPHSPESLYTYEPLAEYDPAADSADCDRLLSALEQEQQDVFLRTISASLDIDVVRRFHGRGVRALLCKGVGSNGKDALREAVSQMWGKTGMSSVALEDFQQYDEGRKFPIAPLASSRINWSSENLASVRMDNLQSLKRAITGDPLHQEFKGRDHKEFKPRAIHLFNVNDVPYLRSAQESIKSRFAILSFNRIFKKNADSSRGEIEVDPRFKDDGEFIEQRILPALLNRTIAAFKLLMAEGIDFACCDAAMQETQISQSHLYEFASESGLTYDSQAVMPIGELWDRLESYYRDTGVLRIEFAGNREIRVWEDPVRPGDPYVKGQNQVAQRFINLYPQCQKVPLGKNRFGIKGLAFKPMPRSSEQSTEQTTEPDENADSPFEAPASIDVQSSEESTHFSDENITNLVDLVQTAIEEGCPETIDSFFEPTPIQIRHQVKSMVMSKVQPRIEQLTVG